MGQKELKQNKTPSAQRERVKMQHGLNCGTWDINTVNLTARPIAAKNVNWYSFKKINKKNNRKSSEKKEEKS